MSTVSWVLLAIAVCFICSKTFRQVSFAIFMLGFGCGLF